MNLIHAGQTTGRDARLTAIGMAFLAAADFGQLRFSNGIVYTVIQAKLLITVR